MALLLTSRQIAAWIAPKQTHRLVLFEVVFFSFLALLLGYLAEPGDPFLTLAPFPWLWLVPTILGLRYGTLAAFGSVGIIALSWTLWDFLGFSLTVFPAHYFMGGLLLSLIAGEFADVWIVRLKRVREANVYLNERLESLTRRHYLVKLSHERLEQDLLTKPMTLRESIMQVRELMLDSQALVDALPHSHELLNLLVQTCQIEVASLYSVKNGLIADQACASIGKITPVKPKDPLVRFALERNELSHLQTEHLQDAESQYLVAAPLVATDKTCHGILLVERMPFLSLNQETLQFLGILLGYYADSLRLAPQVMQVLRQNPNCPLDFAAELLRLAQVYQHSGLPSSILAMVITDSPMRQDLTAEAQRQRRRLDINWDIPLSDRDILVTLMPLHGNAAVTGLIMRMENWVKEIFGVENLAAAHITLHVTQLNERPPAEQLNQLVERCLVRQS